MKYLLDTNTCIRYLNGRSPSIRAKLKTIAPSDVAICSVVKAELFVGAEKSHTPQQTRAKQFNFLQPYRSLPFDDVAAQHYGIIRAYLEQRGTPIGSNDLLIAAIARANNLILVTHNTAEFSRVPQLQIEDWEVEHS